MSDWYKPEILDQYSTEERIFGAFRWILLPRLKEYLKCPSLDGRMERQDMRRELNEIIAKIDELQTQRDEETDW